MSVISDFIRDIFNVGGGKIAEVNKQAGYIPGIASGAPSRPLPQGVQTRPIIEQEEVGTGLSKAGAGAVELLTKIPGVSQVLGAVNFGYKNFWLKPITTPFVMSATDIRNPLTAYRESTDIALPQAIVSSISNKAPIQAARDLYLRAEDQAEYEQKLENINKFAPWLAPDFDLLDPKKRTEAYEENWTGALLTGGMSFVQMIAEGFGAGALVRKAAQKSGLTQTALKDMESIKEQIQVGRDWDLNGRPTTTPNGITVDIIESIKETSPAKLQNIPFFKNMPDEIKPKATNIASKIDNFDDMSDFYLANLGDSAAFGRFFERRTALADAFDDFGIKNNTGLLSQLEIWGIKDAATMDRVYKVVSDLAKTDPVLARITQSWAADIGKGIGYTNWAPSRFATIEQARMALKTVRESRLYGIPLAQVPKLNSGIVGQTVQSDLFTRPVHVVQNVFNERPRWMIDFSDPRGIADASTELLSQVNTVKFFRGPEYNQFKQDFINAYSQGITVTQKKAAVEQFEQDVVSQIAIKYGIREEDAVQLYSQLKIKKQEAQDNIAMTGTLPEGEVGAYLFDDILRSQLATHHIMFDFGLFEREVKRFAAQKGLIKKGKLTGLKGDYYTRDFFDNLNSIFSVAVLVRPGYIPKNAIVEPQMRIFAYGDAFAELNELAPSSKRFLVNTVNRAGYYGDVIYDQVRGKSNKAFSKKTKALSNDINLQTAKLTELETNITDLSNQIRQLENKQFYTYTQKGLEKDSMIDVQILNLKDDLEDLVSRKKSVEQVKSNFQTALVLTQEEWVKESAIRSKLRVTTSIADEDIVLPIKSGKEKITVKSPLAVSAKGGLVMRSEIDPVSAAWSASIQSSQASKLKALTRMGDKVEIRPGDPDYIKAATDEINIRAKNDELVKMWAYGVSADDAVQWLSGKKDIKLPNGEAIGRDSGRGYYNQVVETLSESTNKYQPEYVASIYDYFDKLLPDADLRIEAVNRIIRESEIESRFVGRTDLPPVIGKKSFIPGKVTDRVALAINNFASYSFGLVAGRAERIVSKNPFYIRRWKESVQRQILQAENAGIEVTGEMINDRFRFIANNEALKHVEDTFYTVRRLNNYQYMFRYAAAFPTAFINSYKFWAKAIVKNPYNAVLQYKFQGLPYDLGLVVDQDGNPVERDQPRKDGEERYLIVGQPGYANKNKIEPYTKKVNTDQWNFMLGTVSTSFLGQIALSELVIAQPEKEALIKDVVGESVYNKLLFGGRPIKGDNVVSKLLNVYTPGYLDATGAFSKQFIKELALQNIDFPLVGWLAGEYANPSQADQDAFIDEYLRLRTVAYINWEANGSDPEEEPNEKDLRRAALRALGEKAITKWISPLGITFEPTSQFMRDMRRELEENFATGKLPIPEGQTAFQAAENTMIGVYGPDILRMFSSKYSKQSTFSPTMEDYKTYLNNKGLVESVAKIDPMLVGMITNADVPGEYSPGVAAWMEDSQIGGRPLISRVKTATEVEEEAQERMGWNLYVKYSSQKDVALAKAGLKSLQSKRAKPIADWWDSKKQEIEEEYPAWGRAFGESSSANTVQTKTLPALTMAIRNEKFMASKADNRKWQAVLSWMITREMYFQAYQNAEGNENGQKQIKLEWSEVSQDIVDSDTQFSDFHARYLDQDKFSMGIDDFIRLTKDVEIK